MECSLIISTYNWPEALELCLESVQKQSIVPNEVIIADDGSRPDTQALISKFQQNAKLNISHVWQSDEGFRLAEIRNKAIAASSTPYIIQIDGDVILHPKFIEDHLSAARPRCFIQGSRVMLGQTISQKLFLKKKTTVSLFSSDIKRKENGIRWLGLSKYLQTRYRNRYPLYWARGANMSFWRADLVQVNGYNENFAGWGDEDSELSLRLMNSGISKLHLKFAGIIYHIYHNEDASKAKSSKNRQMLQAAVEQNLTRIENALDKYL